MINILKKIKNYTLSFFSKSYDKCYSNRMCEGNAYNGRCGGLAGGTKATDYLSEHCVSCPYLNCEVIKVSVSIWEEPTKECCFNCQHYHKGFCYAKQIYVEPNSLCAFYMTNWNKVK